jgi:GNAT superfamily N-acetyltransferase
VDGVRIEAIGPDDARFADWHAAIARSYAHGREPGWWEALEAAQIYFARPGAQKRGVALVATVDGGVVGGAELTLPLDADLETMSVELGVLPEARRRGVGAALLSAVEEVAGREGRRVVQAEVFVPTGVEPDEWPGARFADRYGLSCATVETRFLLDVPLPEERLDDLGAGVDEGRSADDVIVSWVGGCPEQYLAEWARMQTQMNQDVPTGELTVTARQVDTERVRESDRRMSEQGWTKVRSMAVGPDGTGRGYTELFVSEHDRDVVVQDDTWVDRRHRGRRLGLRLKVANLRQLQDHGDGMLLGPRRSVQTYCEQDNTSMRRINAAIGFRPVDTLRGYEGPVRGG